MCAGSSVPRLSIIETPGCTYSLADPGGASGAPPPTAAVLRNFFCPKR